MTNIILPKQHILITSENDVAAICKPLFDSFELNYFHFRRTFHDGSFYVLTTNKHWYEYFFEKQIPIQTPVVPSDKNKNLYFCLWEGAIPEETVADAKSIFNIHHPIALIERYETFYDAFSFGSAKKSQSVINFYLNNIDVLIKFTSYFREKSIKLIHLAETQKIILPSSLHDPNIKQILGGSHSRTDSVKDKFFKEIRHEKYNIQGKMGVALLSKREFECLSYVIKGKTAKEIARILSISHRTVEDYVKTAKGKFGCNTKSELSDIWWKNKFDLL